MHQTVPIKIIFLPDWYVQGVGRAKVESMDSIDQVTESLDNPSDKLSFDVTNSVFTSYLYGASNLRVNSDQDSSVFEIQSGALYKDSFIAPKKGTELDKICSNLISCIYGPNSKENEIENKEERFSILCRTFEDVKIKAYASGDMIIFKDSSANNYLNRNNLLKELFKNLFNSSTKERIVKTNLFRILLSSTYMLEDNRYTLFHKVG